MPSVSFAMACGWSPAGYKARRARTSQVLAVRGGLPRVERLPQLGGSPKIGFAEKVEGGRKFEESGLSSIAQDAQGAGNLKPR